MSGSLLQRIFGRLFSTSTVTIDEPDAATAEPQQDSTFERIDSNVATREWFDGRLVAREPIDSNPGTALWWRKPRFVVSAPALHDPSRVGGA